MARLGRRFPVQPFIPKQYGPAAPPTAADVVTIGDSAGVVGASVDTVSISDHITLQRLAGQDSVTVSDALVTIRDAVTASDTVSGLFDSPHISQTSNHVTDHVTFSTDIVRITKILNDAVGISDSVRWILGRSSSDSISITDSVHASRINEAVHDSVVIVDTVHVPEYLVNTADSLSIFDGASGPTGHSTRSSSDTLPLSDLASLTTGSTSVSLSDSVTLSDKPVLGVNGYETIVFSDFVRIKYPPSIDSISISDSSTATPGAVRAFVWQVGVEVLLASTGESILYQFGMEVALAAIPESILYQFGMEVASSFSGNGQIHQMGIEAGNTTPSAMDVYQIGMEVALLRILPNRIRPPAILAPKGNALLGSPRSRTSVPAPTIFGTPSLISS